MHELSSSRRRFLKRAGASIVGAVGLPHLVPESVFGKAGQLPPSERIGLAFLGPGNRGRQLIEEFAKRPDVESVAVCDVSRQVRQRAKELVEQTVAQARPGSTRRVCQAYIDFREALARPDVDGVVVSAPEHWRAIMCIMAAKAGKDVYTEKPFALTVKEGRAMVDAMRRYGRVFQHGTQRRSATRSNCELVRNGRIGRVTHAVVWVGPGPQPFPGNFASWPSPPPREEFDWDLWLGPAPLRPYGSGMAWQGIRDFGLGVIGNWGAHTLDMVQWAIGKDDEGPIEILPPDGENPLALKYDGGLTIYIPRTKGDPHAAVFGTDGQKGIWGSPPVVDKYDDTPLGPGDVHLTRLENEDHYGNWLQCMRTRAKPFCHEGIGYRSGTLCQLIALAERLPRRLRYDPVNVLFPEDDEASRLLDTPKRSPWRVY